MAIRERGVRDGREEAAIGDLIRDFGQDAVTLVRQEIALAKAELKEAAGEYARNAGKLGAAAAAAFFGAMALVAAVIIGLGAAFGNYWVSALLVSVLLLGAGAWLGRSALKQMKGTSLKPEQTVDTLQEDKRWARHELRELKHQLKH